MLQKAAAILMNWRRISIKHEKAFDLLLGKMLRQSVQTETEHLACKLLSELVRRLDLTTNIYSFQFSIKNLPAMAFENLNSLETLSIQNNKLQRIPEEVMEPIIDTLRVVDIMGEF